MRDAKRSQTEIFGDSEGDAWYRRNAEVLTPDRDNDATLKAIEQLQIKPERVLEIGCSNGWRLARLRELYGCTGTGIEPSQAAIADGREKWSELDLHVGVASDLPFDDGSFDVVIFGSCLYLCERNDLFKIAYEADRVLAGDGYIVIRDFYPGFPYKNDYCHFEGLYGHKMKHSKMFTWNPLYHQIYLKVYTHAGVEGRDVPDERVACEVIQRKAEFAYPKNPYPRP